MNKRRMIAGHHTKLAMKEITLRKLTLISRIPKRAGHIAFP